jgi:hypothetical protein
MLLLVGVDLVASHGIKRGAQLQDLARIFTIRLVGYIIQLLLNSYQFV